MITFLSAGKKVSCPGSTFISSLGRLIEVSFFFVFLAFAIIRMYKMKMKKTTGLNPVV